MKILSLNANLIFCTIYNKAICNKNRFRLNSFQNSKISINFSVGVQRLKPIFSHEKTICFINFEDLGFWTRRLNLGISSINDTIRKLSSLSTKILIVAWISEAKVSKTGDVTGMGLFVNFWVSRMLYKISIICSFFTCEEWFHYFFYLYTEELKKGFFEGSYS